MLGNYASTSASVASRRQLNDPRAGSESIALIELGLGLQVTLFRLKVMRIDDENWLKNGVSVLAVCGFV